MTTSQSQNRNLGIIRIVFFLIGLIPVSIAILVWQRLLRCQLAYVINEVLVAILVALVAGFAQLIAGQLESKTIEAAVRFLCAGIALPLIVFLLAVMLIHPISAEECSDVAPTEIAQEPTAVSTETDVPTPVPRSTYTPDPTQPSKPTDTSSPTPMPTVSASPTPSRTPSPSATSATGPPIPLVVPTGYVLFDDFEGTGELSEQWTAAGGNLESCNSTQKDGLLTIECEGHAGQEHVNLRYHPQSSDDKAVRGVAVAGKTLTGTGQNEHVLYLGAIFGEPGSTAQLRAYYLGLLGTRAWVKECYPQEDWACEDLAEVSVSSAYWHLLQIEYAEDGLLFLLDGNLLPLDLQPDIPEGAVWQDWIIQGSLFWPTETAEKMEVLIDWVATRPWGAISWQLCTDQGLQSCQCRWQFKIARNKTDDEVDSWYLRNIGNGALTLFDWSTTCEECLEVLLGYKGETTRDHGDVSIPPNEDGGITIWYHPTRDPQEGTDHDYLITIYSDAKNCPELEIVVPVRYK